MSYEQSNVGLGMVQHRKRCRCDECELERSKTRIAELEAQLAKLKPASERHQAQRDRAHDCLQALLDFVYMIAPEAESEEIDQAERVLRMLGDE